MILFVNVFKTVPNGLLWLQFWSCHICRKHCGRTLCVIFKNNRHSKITKLQLFLHVKPQSEVTALTCGDTRRTYQRCYSRSTPPPQKLVVPSPARGIKWQWLKKVSALYSWRDCGDVPHKWPPGGWLYVARQTRPVLCIFPMLQQTFYTCVPRIRCLVFPYITGIKHLVLNKYCIVRNVLR